ncbi:unnamed protein product [Phytomonas sp. Hart1]|nr:unnamed protein product [Phytomonas sp. Hart1]|eukprot:CCW70063.1 unnamed protein product [Phytomonas sp. isolate Hart1]
MAHKLANKIVSNIYDYRTHDTVLLPLGVTLGDNSEETMDFPFAQTYIIELLQKMNKKTFYPCVLRGFPQINKTGQDGKFSSPWTIIQWYCTANTNNAYVATDNIGPFEDVVRCINSTKPTTQHGLCVIRESLYKKKCPASVKDKFPLFPYCKHHRTVCPGKTCT